MNDDHQGRESFSVRAPGALPASTADRLLSAALVDDCWRQRSSKGRRHAWFSECRCGYRYSGVSDPALVKPGWVRDAEELVFGHVLGLDGASSHHSRSCSAWASCFGWSS